MLVLGMKFSTVAARTCIHVCVSACGCDMSAIRKSRDTCTSAHSESSAVIISGLLVTYTSTGTSGSHTSACTCIVQYVYIHYTTTSIYMCAKLHELMIHVLILEE